MQGPAEANNFDPEELEAWLAEVELVHDKIKKLQTEDLTEVDNKEILKLQNRKKDQEKVKTEQMQKLQEEEIKLIKEGRKGKGEKKDYVSFCKYCFREYIKMTEMCVQCKRPTQSQEERMNDLKQKVKQMQEDKARKADKKQKFELKQKTQKIMWKKNTTNYSKWEDYTSSEEEIEGDPVVPKDDPNFKALEMDMQQRKQRRMEDTKKAEELKEKGNKYFNNGEYDHAAWKYSEAIELIKDNKVYWLNRALAYIKLGKYRKAVKDCSKVIEYAECFENGYTQSSNSCLKAFCRRATAEKYLNRYDDALNDVNAAIQLDANDKYALNLKEEIQELIKHQDTAQKVMQDETLPFREIIDKFISGNNNQDLLQVLKVFKQNSDESIAYFHEKNGLQQLIQVISNEEKVHDEQNLMASLPALLLQLYQEKSIIYQEHFITKFNGIEVILKKIKFLLKAAEGKEKSAIYDSVQDYIEAINILDDESIRSLLQKNSALTQVLYPEMFDRITPLEKEIQLVSAYISLCSNLCYGQSPLKSVFLQNHHSLFLKLGQMMGAIHPLPQYQILYTQICNLLSNLLTEPAFRQKCFNKEYKTILLGSLINLLQTPMNQESALAVFVNLTFQSTLQQQEFVTNDLNIAPALLELLKSSNQLIVERSLTILAKTKYSDDIYIVTKYIAAYPASLKFLLQMLQAEEAKKQLRNPSQLFQLLGALKTLLFKEAELIFCNSCLAIGQIIDIVTISITCEGQNPCSFFQQIVPHLLTIVRDKRGNLRKNAAILLAKLTKDEKNLQALRSLHGIEILNSVISHIL